MLLKELSPATLTPVPLRELAAHLRVSQGFSDDGTEDALLELFLRNATAVIEARLSRALIARPYTLQTASWNRRGHLVLPLGPVAEIDGIRFLRQGTIIDLAPEEWTLEPGTQRQRVTGQGGGPLRGLPHGALAEISFTAGYGPSWNQVPDDLRHAVLLLAAHFYDNRDGEVAADHGMPHGLASLLERHRTVRL